jgi:hypothetical protein
MILPQHKVCFIHIPKTGGSTIEKYLLTKYNLKPSPLTFSHEWWWNDEGGSDARVSNVHLPFTKIVEWASNANIIIDDTWKVFTVVRNPYFRALSDLFFWDDLGVYIDYYGVYNGSIKGRRKKVFEALETFLNYPNHNDYDLHRMPQHWFLKINTSIWDSINILHYEEGLGPELKRIGFGDFPIYETFQMDKFRGNNVERPNYWQLLTSEFIEMINVKYQKDFEIFDYDMLNPNEYPSIHS